MRTLNKQQLTLLTVISMIFLVQCASQNYINKMDVYGIGAGERPETENINAVDNAKLKHVKVGYTPNIKVKEQEANKVVKHIAGEALSRNFSGKPEFLAEWLNEKQKLNNAALLLDKNGTVAWHGIFNKQDIPNILGVEGYSIIGGAKRITFSEAIKEYVDKGKTQKYKDDKEIEFKKGFFDYGKEGPFVYTKLPEFEISCIEGKTKNIQDVTNNGKPTLLIFFLSKARKKYAADVLLSGSGNMQITPGKVLYFIEDVYFFEKE